MRALFSQYTTALFDPPVFFLPSPFCCVAYLEELSLPRKKKKNVIILRPSIRWLSFRTRMRKALAHNRSVGAPVCLYMCGACEAAELGLSVNIVRAVLVSDTDILGNTNRTHV